MAAGMHGEHDGAARPRVPVGPSASSRPLSVIAPDTGPAKRLIARGKALRFRAPELAMVFGERAAALAEAAGSERLWADAEALAVFARVRLGQRASVVNRAVVVLRTAEADGDTELAAQMRVELALCARSVGVPLTGLAALRPVLGDPDISASCRALAMVQLVGCMAPLGRRRVLEKALVEADELATSDVELPAEDRTLLRAMVCGRSAANQRRYGDLAMAIEFARQGLDLLDGLGAADGVQLRARLVLELVCALLDRGSAEQAGELAGPLLAEPARASAAGPLAWLRLAVATRVHLPAGEVEAAGMLVRDALYGTQRHDLQAITARLWLELANIEEAVGRPAEAVHCLREARRYDHAYGRVRRQALGLLTGEFGRGEQQLVDVPQPVESPRSTSTRPVPPPRRGSESTSAPTAPSTQPAAPTQHAGPEPRALLAEPESRTLPEPAAEATAWPSSEPEPAAAVAEPTVQLPETEPLPSSGLTAPDSPAADRPAAGPSAPKSEPAAAPAPKAAALPTHTTPGAAEASARHRADGGADAKSMLERLGVTVSSGGRRRAPGHASAEQPPAAQVVTPKPEPTPEPTPLFEAMPEPTQESKPETPKPESKPEAKQEPEPAEPMRLDSLLAVFSNWTDDDARPGIVAPRVRHRRHENGAEVTPLAANGRKINGDDAAGRHRGTE